MKNETSEVNGFFKLCKKQQELAQSVNENLEIVKAQQKGRSTLDCVYEFMNICDRQRNVTHGHLTEKKGWLSLYCSNYFQTNPLDLKKRLELRDKIKATTKEIDEKVNELKSIDEKYNSLLHKRDKVIETLGDCDTSLEEALTEYRTAVDLYNKTVAKLNKFKGVNIALLVADEMKKAPILKINENFADSDETELLI